MTPLSKKMTPLSKYSRCIMMYTWCKLYVYFACQYVWGVLNNGNEHSCRDTGLSRTMSVENFFWLESAVLDFRVDCGHYGGPRHCQMCAHSVNFVGAKCQLCGLAQYLVSLFGIHFYHPLESWVQVIRFVASPSAGGYTQASVWHVWNRVVFGSPNVCRILMDIENYSYMCVCVLIILKLHICI